MALRALRANGTGELHIIEPYPTEKLDEIISFATKFHHNVVQDVDPSVFEELESGDILFIDSSHVTKTGSDVNYIVFEVLPRLKPGTLIHFHDIFLPGEYPKSWCIDRNWAWNEQYLVLAFLMSHPQVKPLISTHVLIRDHAALVQETLSGCGQVGHLSGAALWLT